MVRAFNNFFIGRGDAVLSGPMQHELIAPYLRTCIVRTPQALIAQREPRDHPSSGLSVAQEIMRGVPPSPQNDEARRTMSDAEASSLYWNFKASAASPSEYVGGAMWRHREMEATAVTEGDDLICVARLNMRAPGANALIKVLTYNSILFEKGVVDSTQYRFIPPAVLKAGLETFSKRPSEMIRVPELALGFFTKAQAVDGTEASEPATEITSPDVYDGIEAITHFLTEQAGGTVKPESVYREVWKAISDRKPPLLNGTHSLHGNATIHLSNFRIDDERIVGTLTLERNSTTPKIWQLYLVRFQEGRELDQSTREMVTVYSPIFSTKEPRGPTTARPRGRNRGAPLKRLK